jgi:hypothetical protein
VSVGVLLGRKLRNAKHRKRAQEKGHAKDKYEERRKRRK